MKPMKNGGGWAAIMNSVSMADKGSNGHQAIGRAAISLDVVQS